MPAVTVTAPARSKPRVSRTGAWSRRISRQPATRMSRPRITGAKNTHRQSTSVSSPPITRPNVKPAAPVAP